MKAQSLKTACFLSLTAISCAAVAQEPPASSAASTAYGEGYSLVLAQKWEEAKDYFADFKQRWAESDFADDAGYWHCYATEQSGGDAEGNFNCYSDFISQWNNAGSNWVDDARNRMIFVAANLARDGRPEFIGNMMQSFRFPELPEMPEMHDMPVLPMIDREALERTVEQAMHTAMQVRDQSAVYRDLVQTFQFSRRGGSSMDSELLALITALQDDPRAAELLLSRLENSDDPDVQARLVLLLQDMEGQEITAKLVNMVRNSPHEQVQRNAVIALLERNDAGTRELLQEVATDSRYPLNARIAVVSGIGRWEQAEATPLLSRLLANEENTRLVRIAARQLVQINTQESRQVLINHYRNISDADLRRDLLDQMEDARSPEMISFFTEVALGSDDREATVAIRNLANREDNMGVAALEHIYANTNNERRHLAVINGMGEARISRGAEFLSTIASQNNNHETQSAVVRALGATRQAQAANSIMEVYRRTDNAEVRAEAVRAMSRLRDHPQAREFMLEMLDTELTTN